MGNHTVGLKSFSAACAALFSLVGCSGGSGDPVAAQAATVSVSFSSSTSAALEAAGAHAVGVELTLSAGVSSGEVTVTLSDLASGNATSGSDYIAVAPTVVTFPAGSASGTVEMVSVTLLDDNSIEGADELLELGIAGLTGPATLGSVTQHDVTIQESNVATIGFQSSTSNTTDEATAAHAVQVTLTYGGGDTLDATVNVTVSDGSAGTATSGVDYTAFVNQVVTFVAGTASGSSVNVMLGVQDDSDFELDETAILQAISGASGAQVGISAHTITIPNDDAAPALTMVVQSDLPGAQEFPTSGDTFAFANAVLGAGPTGQIDLSLLNVGTADLDLSVLNLSGDIGDFTIDTGVTSATPEPPVDLFSPMLTESVSVDQGAVVTLSEELLADLVGRNEVVMHAFPLPDGGAVDLRLTRVPSPWQPDAVLEINGEPVPGGPQSVLGELSMWRGEVVDAVGSQAFLSFSEQGSRGWIRLSELTDDVVHLVSEGTPAGITSHIIGAPALAALTDYVPEACAGTLLPPGAPDPTLPLDEPGPGVEALNVIQVANARLVIETDWQYYQKFNDTGLATTYVTQLIAAISDRYETDVQASLSIAYLGIHDNSSDGWSTPETSGADTADMLTEFRATWGSSWPGTGDLAHFISGANLGGGIAYVDVLCNQSYGFGVSANISGNINWGTFTGGAGSLNWDFVVVAHELGHNFGASHTHSYCPPLDQCYTNCNSSNVCSQGTIMSYCHTCGGMSAIDLAFHPYIATRIRTRIAASCLGGSTISTGDSATFSLYFEPNSSTGAKSATLSFTHTATNIPSPYTLVLTGTATN